GVGEVAPTHAGLIGHENEQKTRIHQIAQSTNGSRKDDHVFRLMEIIPLFNQSSVTIQEYRALKGNLHGPDVTGAVRNRKTKRLRRKPRAYCARYGAFQMMSGRNASKVPAPLVT